MRNRTCWRSRWARFSTLAVEAAIYVWMPTLLAGYSGPATCAGGLQHLDLLSPARRRALPRRVDADAVRWQAVLACSADCILLCFVGTVAGGVDCGGLSAPCCPGCSCR